MDIKHIVEITITDMKDSKITGFILDGKQYHNNNDDNKTIETKTPKKRIIKKRMKNIIDTWIKNNPNLTVFTLEDFFTANPQHLSQRKRCETYFNKMCSDKTLTQVNNNGKVMITHRMKKAGN